VEFGSRVAGFVLVGELHAPPVHGDGERKLTPLEGKRRLDAEGREDRIVAVLVAAVGWPCGQEVADLLRHAVEQSRAPLTELLPELRHVQSFHVPSCNARPT
jgi:hypothetical protein